MFVPVVDSQSTGYENCTRTMKLVSSVILFFAASLSRPVWGKDCYNARRCHAKEKEETGCAETDTCKWDIHLCEFYCISTRPFISGSVVEDTADSGGDTFLDAAVAVTLDVTSCKTNGCPVMGQSCLVNDKGESDCYNDSVPGSLPAGWWDLVSTNFEGQRLKVCNKLGGVAPNNGTRCGAKPKTCFFGDQACAISGVLQPKTRCYCNGREGGQKWNCQEIGCVDIFE